MCFFSVMKEILVLGAEGSGKSLLIRRVKEHTEGKFSVDTTSESTIPTTGVEIVHVELSSDVSCNVREIGSAISSRWDSYLSESCGLIFAVDVSDLGSLSSALVLLHEILSNTPLMVNKRLLLVLNKTDCVERSSVVLAKNILRLNELQRLWPLMSVRCGSCVSGDICESVIDWMKGCLTLD